MQRRGTLRVDRAQQFPYGAVAEHFSRKPHPAAEQRVGALAGEFDVFQKRLHVQSRAAAKNDLIAAGTDLPCQLRSVFAEFRRAERRIRRKKAEQVMHNALKLVVIRSRRRNKQIAVDLHGVCRNNFGTEIFCEPHRERRLARRGRTDERKHGDLLKRVQSSSPIPAASFRS